MTLTIKQERLLGLPNSFMVYVPDFPQNGKLTPYRVKEDAEKTLSRGGISLVENYKKGPLAKIILNVVPDSQTDKITGTDYLIDINVYNLSTIATEYDLREGTVWKIGSYKETLSRTYPRAVQKRIRVLLEYFMEDYFAANPYLKKPVKEEEHQLRKKGDSLIKRGGP